MDYKYEESSNNEMYYSEKPKRKHTALKVIFTIILIAAISSLSILTYMFINGYGFFEKKSDKKEVLVSDNTKPPSNNLKTGVSVEDIIKKNAPAVVEINTESISTDSWLPSYIKEGAGSGVIIKSDGYILTCNHVIDKTSNIKVRLSNKKEYPAKVVGKDVNTDVAIIKIDAENLSTVKFGNSSNLSPGDSVVAIGNPLGKLGGSASQGIISALDRQITVDGFNMNLLQTDTAINPGNSGGGLFDGNGNLIGIVVAKSGGTNIEGIGFAIPVNKALPIANELISKGSIKSRPMIGISVISIDDKYKAEEYGVKDYGLYIAEVTGDEAKKAGFKKKDRIIAVDGNKITGSADLFTQLEKHKIGDRITIKISRNDREMSLKTTLVQNPN